MPSAWWRRSTSSQITQHLNPAPEDCNGLKWLVVSLFVQGFPLPGKLLAWRNQPRGNGEEMMAIKQNGAVDSLYFFSSLEKLPRGFKTKRSLLWAYRSPSIILWNHGRLYFTIIWSDVSKLPGWWQGCAQCARAFLGSIKTGNRHSDQLQSGSLLLMRGTCFSSTAWICSLKISCGEGQITSRLIND